MALCKGMKGKSEKKIGVKISSLEGSLPCRCLYICDSKRLVSDFLQSGISKHISTSNDYEAFSRLPNQGLKLEGLVC